MRGLDTTSTLAPTRRAAALPWAAALAGGLALVFAAVGVHVAIVRGPWLDEFWTLWFSLPEVPLAVLAAERWRADFHPPLFSALQWLLAHPLGDSIAARRVVNLLPLAWATGFAALVVRRYPRCAPLLLAFAVLLLSWATLLRYFAEMRSYFMQFCFLYTFVGGLLVLDDAPRGPDARGHGPLFAALFGASAVVSLNLHYLNSLLAGAMLASFALSFWLRGERRLAGWLLALGALGSLPMLAIFVAQLRFFDAELPHYWVSGGLADGLRLLALQAQRAATANPLALAAAMLALAAALWPALRRRLDAPPLPGRAIAALAGGVGLYAAAMLAVQLRQPIIVERYLLSWQVGVLALVAALTAGLLSRRAWAFGLFAAFAAAGVLREGAILRHDGRWDDSAAEVERIVARCPAAAVFSADPGGGLMAANGSRVRVLGHQWVARRHGFAATPLDVAGGRLPAEPSRCPAVLWLEHVRWAELPRDATPAQLLQRLALDASPFDLAAARIVTTESGLVLTLPFAR